jgi:hypothetical protein
MSRLNSGSGYERAVQNLLPSHLQTKNVKLKYNAYLLFCIDMGLGRS